MEHSPLLMAIKANVEHNPNKIAIIANEVEVTFAELWKRSIQAAHLLLDLGIHQRDTIILSARKDIEYIYVYLGAQILGVVNVLVDAEQNVKRLEYIENKISPKFCFGYSSRTYPYKLFSELDFTNISDEVVNIKDIVSSDVAEILFTTGTTGDPKGVCLSYDNIFSSASNINSFIQNTTEDIEVLGLPVCHSFGMGRLRCNLIKGSTIILLGNFANVRLFLKTIEKYKVTGFGVVPAAWSYIRKISGTRLSKFANQLNFIEIGSAAMPIETKKEMLQMFPKTRICMHYGLTEASRSTFLEFHDLEHLNSIGKPVSEKVDIKIFNSDGLEMPAGQGGELCVKGNMVMVGYFDQGKSSEAFHGEYFRTGDNGFIQNDGYIYLLGREKELINVGGKKVSPMEVEDTIISLGVGDCVCVAMPDPDGIMGERVKCYILKDSTTLSFDEIDKLLSTKLEQYKRPVVYEWINEIPVTSSGKKQRVFLNGNNVNVIRTSNGLYYRTFQELKDNTDLGYDDRDGIMAMLDNNQKEAILNKPTGFNGKEICQILAVSENRIVGTQMCYSDRVIIDGEELICNHASTVYSHPDFRSKGVGGNLLMALSKLPPYKNTITGGNSQLSLPIFKALRYDSFEFPRFIFLNRSRSAFEYLLHSTNPIIRPISFLVDTFLYLHKKMVCCSISSYAKSLKIELCNDCPIEVEEIVSLDSHRFREHHDKAWFDWNLKYDFNPDARKSKKLYVLKDGSAVVGFFVNKIQFYKTASSRGFKNVLLGSVMEWGIRPNSKLTEIDVQLLAIKSMPKEIDGVQVATDDVKVAKTFSLRGFFRIGEANMCVRLRSIKDKEVKSAMKEVRNWRLRLACNDTLVD